MGKSLNCDLSIIQEVEKANVHQRQIFLDKIISAYPTNLNTKTCALFGLAFKADIDDLRESPSMAIARKIASSHVGEVLAVEPNIVELPNEEAFHLVNADQALSKAHVIVLLVDHSEFKKLAISKSLKLIDTKGIWKC